MTRNSRSLNFWRKGIAAAEKKNWIEERKNFFFWSKAPNYFRQFSDLIERFHANFQHFRALQALNSRNKCNLPLNSRFVICYRNFCLGVVFRKFSVKTVMAAVRLNSSECQIRVKITKFESLTVEFLAGRWIGRELMIFWVLSELFNWFKLIDIKISVCLVRKTGKFNQFRNSLAKLFPTPCSFSLSWRHTNSWKLTQSKNSVKKII